MKARRVAFALLLWFQGRLVCCFAFSASTSRRSSTSTSSRFSSSSSTINDDDASGRQKQILLQRGEVEAKLMAASPSSLPLFYHAPGAVKHVETLAREGVVGIDNVLPSADGSNSCQQLRDYILDYRTLSREAISQKQISRNERFAKCLLSDHRDDLLLPLTTVVQQALQHILEDVGDVFEHSLGPDATLFELAALISDPGSARQNVHPDHACSDKDNNKPLVLTCFVALQTIDADMGPTVWIPQTHTTDMHARFQRRRVEDVFSLESPKDVLIRSMPHSVGHMPAGACALFDSRLLHAGTANTSKKSRILFYFSFQRKDANVGGERGSLGYGLERAALTVSDLLSCKSE